VVLDLLWRGPFDLAGNGVIDLLAILWRHAVAEPIEPDVHVVPEPDARAGPEVGTVEETAEMGDMPLIRFAVDPDALDQARFPANARMAKQAFVEPDAMLPTDEHGP